MKKNSHNSDGFVKMHKEFCASLFFLAEFID